MNIIIEKATIIYFDAVKELIDQSDNYHAENLPTIFQITDDKKMIYTYYQGIMEKDNLFIALLDDKVIGFITLYFKTTPSLTIFKPRMFSVIDNLFVIPEVRGKGIGEMLVSHVEKISREKGVDNIELNVYTFNENAIKLYDKLGYKVRKYEMEKKIN